MAALSDAAKARISTTGADLGCEPESCGRVMLRVESPGDGRLPTTTRSTSKWRAGFRAGYAEPFQYMAQWPRHAMLKRIQIHNYRSCLKT